MSGTIIADKSVPERPDNMKIGITRFHPAYKVVVVIEVVAVVVVEVVVGAVVVWRSPFVPGPKKANKSKTK